MHFFRTGWVITQHPLWSGHGSIGTSVFSCLARIQYCRCRHTACLRCDEATRAHKSLGDDTVRAAGPADSGAGARGGFTCTLPRAKRCAPRPLGFRSADMQRKRTSLGLRRFVIRDTRWSDRPLWWCANHHSQLLGMSTCHQTCTHGNSRWLETRRGQQAS